MFWKKIANSGTQALRAKVAPMCQWRREQHLGQLGAVDQVMIEILGRYRLGLRGGEPDL